MHREHYQPERAPSRIRTALGWLWLTCLMCAIGFVTGLGI